MPLSDCLDAVPATVIASGRRDDLLVRLMRDGEAEAVGALARGAYAGDFTLSAGYLAEIEAVAERSREHCVWVATDARTGEILGTVTTPEDGRTMSPVASRGEMDFRFLGVAGSARGRGVGEALVRHALALAASRGIRRVVLNTGPQMRSAQRLYERLGFERLHERERMVDLPDGTSFLLMAYGRDVDAASDRTSF